MATYYGLRGNCYVEMGNSTKALADFERAISIATDPEKKMPIQETLLLDDVELVKLGRRLFNTWKFREAIWCYTEAIKRNSSEACYYRMRGDCYLRMQNLDMAIEDFRTAVQLDPPNRNGRLLLSRALFDYGRFDEAIDVTLTLDDGEIVNLADKLMYSKKRYEQALRCYTEAIKKCPEHAEYYGKRGYCYMETRNWDMAIADFRNRLLRDPQNMETWYQLILALFRSGKFTDAVQEMGVLNDTELEKLGHDFSQMNQLEGAIMVYTEAIKKKPKACYYRLRGDCYLKLKNFETAIFDLKKAMEIDPNNEDERLRLREILFEFEKYNEAIEETIPLDDIQLMILGHKFYNLNKFEEAIRCYTEAINKNPENYVCYERRGLCHWQLKHVEEAISDFRKSLQLVPARKPIQINLYRALVAAGREDEAKEVLENLDEKNRRYFQGQESYKLREAHRKTMEMEEATKRITYPTGKAYRE